MKIEIEVENKVTRLEQYYQQIQKELCIGINSEEYNEILNKFDNNIFVLQSALTLITNDINTDVGKSRALDKLINLAVTHSDGNIYAPSMKLSATLLKTYFNYNTWVWFEDAKHRINEKYLRIYELLYEGDAHVWALFLFKQGRKQTK